MINCRSLVVLLLDGPSWRRQNAFAIQSSFVEPTALQQLWSHLLALYRHVRCTVALEKRVSVRSKLIFSL